MKLYGALGSPFVARVVLAARIKALDLPLLPPPGWDHDDKGEETFKKARKRIEAVLKDPNLDPASIRPFFRHPEFLRINPLARVPTLEHNGRHIFESLAILEYLEEVFPQTPLLPSEPFDRARVRTLVMMGDSYLGPAIMASFGYWSSANRDPIALEADRDRVAIALSEYESVMGDGPWVYGDRISLADCVLIPSVRFVHLLFAYRGDNAGLDALDERTPFTGYPKLARWWNRVCADPLTATFVEDLSVLRRALEIHCPERTEAVWNANLRVRMAGLTKATGRR